MNDIDHLTGYCISQGWHVDLSRGGNHIKVFSPDGKMVVLPSTPSDWRSVRNSIADLRRAGLAVPHKNQRPRRLVCDLSDGELIAERFHLDLTVPRYPHITEYLGMWRAQHWFDETFMPHDDRTWPGPSDASIASSIILSEVISLKEYKLGERGTLAHAKINAIDEADLKAKIIKGKKLRIMFDAARFWCDFENETTPITCVCGKYTAINDFTGYELAAHVLDKYEKADYGHGPGGDYRAWSNPDDLVRLFAPDERDIKIASLEEELERIKVRLIAKEAILSSIRGALK